MKILISKSKQCCEILSKISYLCTRKTTKSVHTKPKGHNHQNKVRPKNKKAKVIIDKIILTGIIKKRAKGIKSIKQNIEVKLLLF